MIHIPTGAVDVQPSGDFFMRKEQHLRLNALIRRYSSGSEAVIVGVYGTHVHSDSFKMYYDEKGMSHYLTRVSLAFRIVEFVGFTVFTVNRAESAISI